MKVMTDEELLAAILAHQRRRKVFQDEGLSQEEAYELADDLWDRDENGGEERVCFECRHLEGKKSCTKIRDSQGNPTNPDRFVLQRCDKFKLKGKNYVAVRVS
jgi:hypothetical protein